MKAYGHSRKDKQECRYGCCTGKSGKERSCREVVDRSNRKTARQYANVEIREETTEQKAKRELGFPIEDWREP